MSQLPENCPVCGAKMEKGYASAVTDIYWTERKGKWGLPPLHWVSLLGGRFFPWMVYAEAHRCPNCKIVMFGYGKKQEKRVWE